MSMLPLNCWTSPADEKGNVDNILTRLSRVEEILSQLMGMDVSALQLADIVGKAGVLEDLIATNLNSEGGWVTDGTYSGVSIKSTGWKMSDGSEFPIVSMVNGVLQFGFGKDGNIGGVKADNWDYAFQQSTEFFSGQDYGRKDSSTEETRGMTIDTWTNVAGATSGQIIPSREGLYFISTYFELQDTGQTPGNNYYYNHQINGVGVWPGTPNVKFYGIADNGGVVKITGGLSIVAYLYPGDAAFFVLTEGGGGSSFSPASPYGMSMFRISN